MSKEGHSNLYRYAVTANQNAMTLILNSPRNKAKPEVLCKSARKSGLGHMQPEVNTFKHIALARQLSVFFQITIVHTLH